MSGGARWTPFEIDPREYVDAVAALRDRDGYTMDPPPAWVASLQDWERWRLEAFLGARHDVAQSGFAKTPAQPVRTEADDQLMRIARAYSDAQRARNPEALARAEAALQKFMTE
jgi:hypothetical protein